MQYNNKWVIKFPNLDYNDFTNMIIRTKIPDLKIYGVWKKICSVIPDRHP